MSRADRAIEAIHAYSVSIGLESPHVSLRPFGSGEVDVVVTGKNAEGLESSRVGSIIIYPDEDTEATLERRLTILGRRLSWIVKKDLFCIH